MFTAHLVFYWNNIHLRLSDTKQEQLHLRSEQVCSIHHYIRFKCNGKIFGQLTKVNYSFQQGTFISKTRSVTLMRSDSTIDSTNIFGISLTYTSTNWTKMKESINVVSGSSCVSTELRMTAWFERSPLIYIGKWKSGLWISSHDSDPCIVALSDSQS